MDFSRNLLMHVSWMKNLVENRNFINGLEGLGSSNTPKLLWRKIEAGFDEKSNSSWFLAYRILNLLSMHTLQAEHTTLMSYMHYHCICAHKTSWKLTSFWKCFLLVQDLSHTLLVCSGQSTQLHTCREHTYSMPTLFTACKYNQYNTQ